MIRSPGAAGFDSRPAPIASSRLIHAVAASSAFPPILSPCVVEMSRFSDARGAQRTVYLTDGGVFDNLGLEPLAAAAAHRIVLSSDGGAPFTRKSRPPLDYLGGTVHVLKVVDLQVRKLRRSQLVSSAKSGERAVGYWALIACNVVLPQFLWIKKVRDSVAALFFLAVAPIAVLAADKNAVQPIKVVALDRKGPVKYEANVEPILLNKCSFCHSGNLPCT